MADELFAGHDLRCEAGRTSRCRFGGGGALNQIDDRARVALAQFPRCLALDELLDIGVVLRDRDRQILVGRLLRVDCFPDKAAQFVHGTGIPDSVSYVQ
ncbi:hypothetical protein D9M69_477900 [compost metagenome]